MVCLAYRTTWHKVCPIYVIYASTMRWIPPLTRMLKWNINPRQNIITAIQMWISSKNRYVWYQQSNRYVRWKAWNALTLYIANFYLIYYMLLSFELFCVVIIWLRSLPYIIYCYICMCLHWFIYCAPNSLIYASTASYNYRVVQIIALIM